MLYFAEIYLERPISGTACTLWAYCRGETEDSKSTGLIIGGEFLSAISQCPDDRVGGLT